VKDDLKQGMAVSEESRADVDEIWCRLQVFELGVTAFARKRTAIYAGEKNVRTYLEYLSGMSMWS